MLICEEVNLNGHKEEDKATIEEDNNLQVTCQCHVCLEIASSHAPINLMDEIFNPTLDGGGFHLHHPFHCSDTDAACLDHCIDSESEIDSIQLTMDFDSKFTQKENSENTFPKQRNPCQNGVGVVKDASTDSHCAHSCNHNKHSDKIKRISCSDRNDSCDDAVNSDSKVQQCDCCYCEVFGHGMPPSAPMSRNFMEMRERLRFILNKKKTNCKGTPPTMPLEEHNLNDKKVAPKLLGKGDTRNLDELLDFIEGNEAKIRNEKKAAKKARQKEKKEKELQKKIEEERAHQLKLEALAKAELQKSLESKKAKANQQNNKNAKNNKNKPNANNNNSSNNTSNKKDGVAQMVTIKRIMDSSNAEPTVTITLRGATPNQDRVLYTLFNGQVCEVTKESLAQEQALLMAQQQQLLAKQQASQKQPYSAYKVPQHINEKFSALSVSSNPKPSKKEKKQKKEVKEVAKPVECVEPTQTNRTNHEINKNSNPAKNKVANPPSSQVSSNAVNHNAILKHDARDFKIEDLKLPPGITITKVDPCTVRSKVPIKDNNGKQTNSSNSNQTSMSSEVIVVATGNLKDQNRIQSGDCSVENSANSSNNVKKKKNKKKNDTVEINSMNTQVNGYSRRIPDSDFSMKENNYQQNSVTISFNSNPCSKYQEKKTPSSLTATSQDFKKKKKKAKNAPVKEKEPEEWRSLDNVFAPKDIDLDNGDIDDDERELEAFKRFCSQSVPPKCKEKVHFNIKDIIVKKSSTSLNDDYDS